MIIIRQDIHLFHFCFLCIGFFLLKVIKSRKQFLELSILPINERKTWKNYPKSSQDIFFSCFVCFLEDLRIPIFFLRFYWPLIVHRTYIFAILKCLVESFTQQQITLNLGTLEELFDLWGTSLYTQQTSTHWFLCCGCFHCFWRKGLCSIFCTHVSVPNIIFLQAAEFSG